jgi:hypothetical protein
MCHTNGTLMITPRPPDLAARRALEILELAATASRNGHKLDPSGQVFRPQ